MKSMPASSAMRASFRLSGQVPDQRSGTLVTARPEEQLAPNSPIFSALPPVQQASAAAMMNLHSARLSLRLAHRRRVP